MYVFYVCSVVLLQLVRSVKLNSYLQLTKNRTPQSFMDAKLELTNLVNSCRLVKTTTHFHKHDVTKIRQNGVINFIVSNSTVIF